MAAAPGFSLADLFLTLGRVKEIWDAFYGEFDNAPYRLRELNDTFDFLQSALVTCRNLCQLQGIELPRSLVRPLVGKLQECRVFTHKYRSLNSERGLPASQGRTVLQRGRQGIDTIRYTFDGDAARLKSDLTSETIKLSTFTNMLQMGLLVSVIRPTTNSNNNTLTSTAPAPQNSNIPIPQSNLSASDATEFLELYPELRDSVTTAPLQGSRRSKWASRISWHRRSRPETQPAAVPFSPAPLLSTITLVSNNFTMPDNSFYCSANIVIGSRPILLQSYSILQSDSGPVIEWRGVDNAISISHYLGPETIPLTTHSVHRKHRHQVHFHFPHRIMLWNGGRLCEDRWVDVEYQFVNEEPMRRRLEFETFQGRLCGRELIGGRFECDWIRSRKSTEARNQHLKIWKSNTESLNYVLSFYIGKKRANNIHLHQEYPVRWFEKTCDEVNPKKMRYTVQLRFVNPLGGSDNTNMSQGSNSRSSINFSSMLSSIGSSTASTNNLSSPPNYAFEGLETLTVLSPSINYAKRYASQDIIHETEFLLIKFTSDTDMDNFKITFHEAHASMESAEDPDVLALANTATGMDQIPIL